MRIPVTTYATPDALQVLSSLRQPDCQCPRGYGLRKRKSLHTYHQLRWQQGKGALGC
jgi:hypothetical protein